VCGIIDRPQPLASELAFEAKQAICNLFCVRAANDQELDEVRFHIHEAAGEYFKFERYFEHAPSGSPTHPFRVALRAMQEIARELVNGKKHDLGNLGQLYSLVQDRVHAADLEYEKELKEASRRLSKQEMTTEDIMERGADGFFERASSDDEAEPKETFPGKRCVQDFPTPENHFYHLLEEPPVVQGATAVNCTTDETAFEKKLSGFIE
jgi:hypothetical protein